MNELSRRGFLGSAAAGLALAAGESTAARAEKAARSRQEPEEGELPGRTAHTRFAVNIEMWFPKLPFLERIEQAAALGFRAIEFWPWQGKDLDAIGARCKELDLDVAQFTGWGFRPGLNDPANHPAFLEAIEEACQAAHKVGAKLLTVIAGDNQPDMTIEEMHAAVIEGLKQAAPIAEREGITLILEPMNGRVDHPGHCLYGSEPAIKICREVASPHVKINWDLYHMQIAEGDLTGHLRDGLDQLGYVQIADHPGRYEPGTGEIAWTFVFQTLAKLGYRGWVGMEFRPKTTELEAAWAVNRADRW